MADVAPSSALKPGGRVVARFHTEPAEVWATGSAFIPPLHIGIPGGKKGLFVLGLAAGMVLALGRDYLPGWPNWLTWVLWGLVSGLFLSTTLWILLGRRSQRHMAVMARQNETQEATVTCHEDGLSWATPEIVHTLAYRAIDQAAENAGTILIRYRLFVLYVPPRGFLSPDDRDHLIGALTAALPPDKRAGLAVAEG